MKRNEKKDKTKNKTKIQILLGSLTKQKCFFDRKYPWPKNSQRPKSRIKCQCLFLKQLIKVLLQEDEFDF